jgi:hypothetical protein
MLEHTLARADQVSGAARKVTVIGSSHLRFAGTQVDRSKAGTVVMQPRNCDTAPGIFLPLTYVRALDPAATVAIFPSDHFVYPENRFIEHANAAVAAARELGDRVILLGVAPDAAELDYGWVEPGYRIPEVSGGRVRAVREFIEKPPAGVAKRALKRGALWNTFVMAAPVETLWQMGRDCFPAMMTLFEALSDAIGRPEGRARIDLPAAPARQLLERSSPGDAHEGCRDGDEGRALERLGASGEDRRIDPCDRAEAQVSRPSLGAGSLDPPLREVERQPRFRPRGPVARPQLEPLGDAACRCLVSQDPLASQGDDRLPVVGNDHVVGPLRACLDDQQPFVAVAVVGGQRVQARGVMVDFHGPPKRTVILRRDPEPSESKFL